MPAAPQPINPIEEHKKVEEWNFRLFREVLGGLVIEKSRNIKEKVGRKTKAKKIGKGKGSRQDNSKRDDEKIDSTDGVYKTENEEGDDKEELGEFIDVRFLGLRQLRIYRYYLATEIFTSLPAPLRTLTYTIYQSTSSLQIYTPPLSSSTLQPLLNTIPLSITETLSTYFATSSSTSSSDNFLKNTLNNYLEEVLKKPLPPRLTKDKAEGCEICGRSWIPLSYHHLIPRSVHAKALKKGWWSEERLEDVAWICRGCHSFIHSVATNEELAREFYTVEKLLEREDVIAFAKWIGGVRWKAR
ncbi:hypothetical protein HYFRA_00013768 [Hymenoscyphus fraxineus]|uniref:HNH domain-containing protein n=1 Tax=Hymenoscyphus fraxineus TaxID=746836 RepID=A0A9N9LBV4_9HELO|nr:hypothetical protein HYFRA_00013768 [Hymenoscyphus fraxineus]